MSESKTIASYEVLAQPLAPVPNVPFVQQGAFLQVTNLKQQDTTIDIEYIGTPPFLSASGVISLFTNVISETGLASATSYPVSTFLIHPVGFKSQVIPGNTTWLFGVQYLVNPGATPPSTGGIDARGYVRLRASDHSKLLVLATTRQVFNNYEGGTLLDVAESAYPVPLATGPEIEF